MGGHAAGAAFPALAGVRVPGSRANTRAHRHVQCKARRGVSPLSGEPYDERSSRDRYESSSYDDYDNNNRNSSSYDGYDEVVTTLWLPMRDLGLGDVGTDVGMLQQAFGLQPTGVFDKNTAREIAKWQQDVGLPKTGYFGVASREAFARAAADASSSRSREYSDTSSSSSYGQSDRSSMPYIDALKPKTVMRRGRDLYRAGVAVPTQNPDRYPTQPGNNTIASALVLTTVAAAAGAAFARREGYLSFERGGGKESRRTRASPFEALAEIRSDRWSNNSTNSSFSPPSVVPAPPTTPVRPPATPIRTNNKYRAPSQWSAPQGMKTNVPAEPKSIQSMDQSNAAAGWSGKPPAYEDLVGFVKKDIAQDRVGESSESIRNRVASGVGEKDKQVTDMDVDSFGKKMKRTNLPLKKTEAGTGSSGGFAANLPKKVPVVDTGKGNGAATNDANAVENTATAKQSDTKSKSDDAPGGFGGVLKKVFGLDGKKSDTSVADETQKKPSSKTDQAVTDDTTKETPSDVPKEKQTDEKKSLIASDQMARLALLREEEEERLAKINRGGEVSGTEKVSSNDSTAPLTIDSSTAPSTDRPLDEKELLRLERQQLMQRQSEREEKKKAKEKEEEFRQRVAAAKQGRVVHPPPKVTPTPPPSTPSPMFTDITTGDSGGIDDSTASDQRHPIQGWREKPGRAVELSREETPSEETTSPSDDSFTIPPLPEKSFDEMSFEERVAHARKQSENSGIADSWNAALKEVEEREAAAAAEAEREKEEKEAKNVKQTVPPLAPLAPLKEEKESPQKIDAPEPDVRNTVEEPSTSEEAMGGEDDEDVSDVVDDATHGATMDEGWSTMHEELQNLAGDEFYERVAEAEAKAEAVGGGSVGCSDTDGDSDKGTAKSTPIEPETDETEMSDVAKAMRQGLKDAAAAEAEWEKAMLDAADIADTRHQEDEHHFDVDGWAERAQADLQEAQKLFAMAAEDSYLPPKLDEGNEAKKDERRAEEERLAEAEADADANAEAEAEANAEAEAKVQAEADAKLESESEPKTPKPKKKRGKFSAMLDEDAVEDDWKNRATVRSREAKTGNCGSVASTEKESEDMEVTPSQTSPEEEKPPTDDTPSEPEHSPQSTQTEPERNDPVQAQDTTEENVETNEEGPVEQLNDVPKKPNWNADKQSFADRVAAARAETVETQKMGTGKAVDEKKEVVDEQAGEKPEQFENKVENTQEPTQDPPSKTSDRSEGDDVDPENERRGLAEASDTQEIPRPAAPPGWWDTHPFPPVVEGNVPELSTQLSTDVSAVEQTSIESVDGSVTIESMTIQSTPDVSAEHVLQTPAPDTPTANMLADDSVTKSERERYAQMLRDRSAAALTTSADDPPWTYQFEPGDFELCTPRAPTREERSKFGSDYSYSQQNKDGIATGWVAPSCDVPYNSKWGDTTREGMKPPSRGAFMGAPSSSLQPLVEVMVPNEKPTVSQEEVDAYRKRNGVEADDAPAPSPASAEETTEPQWRPPAFSVWPREDGDVEDEENVRRSVDEDDEVGETEDVTEQEPETVFSNSAEDENDETEEDVVDRSEYNASLGSGSFDSFDEFDDEDDGDWNDAGPGYIAERSWDDGDDDGEDETEAQEDEKEEEFVNAEEPETDEAEFFERVEAAAAEQNEMSETEESAPENGSASDAYDSNPDEPEEPPKKPKGKGKWGALRED